MDLVTKATNYIKENKKKIDPTFRSKFHMEPTVGWLNDPNGLIYFGRKFHLFYQQNPYNSLPGDMGWGHFISRDLIKYREIDTCMYPDGFEKGECGCWTGSSFVESGEMKLVYTRHYDGRGMFPNVQTQHLVTTQDNIKYTKHETPLINNDEMPENLSRADFRDPQIFYYFGTCVMIIGCQNENKDGVFVVYTGPNSSSLHYSFHFGPFKNTERMVECPSFIRIGNKDVIIYSSFKFDGTNGVYYLIGQLDLLHRTFLVEGEGELDGGDAFYAPKVIENYKYPTLIGWMDNWNKKYPTNEYGHGYAGAFTIPRILEIKNNMLYQKIHPNLYKYIVDEKQVENNGCIDRLSINLVEFCSDFQIIVEGENGKFCINKYKDDIYLSMQCANNMHKDEHKSKFKYSTGKLTFLLDTSSIELFIDDGKETISTRFYVLGEKYKIRMEGIDKFTSKTLKI